MFAIKKILYAVKQADSTSEAAFAKCVAIARSCDASIELFHAISTPLYLPTDTLGAHSIDEIKRDSVELYERRLEKLAALAHKLEVPVRCSVVWDHPPHEAIVRRAEQIGADLIIAQCHEGKRGKPWLVYLTDFELLRVSEFPVLLLKNAQPYRRPVVLAAVDPAHAHAKPFDLDTKILADSRGIAAALRGKLHVMHASDPLLVGLAYADPLIGTHGTGVSYVDLENHERNTFEQLMLASDVPVEQRHFVDGLPVKAIPRLARKLSAGLVVMGAVSRSGLQRVFIGNTAERVLGDLPCDVLVVKPVAFKKRVPAARREALVLGHGHETALAH